MAFNRSAFTQAAKAMGYSDDEINKIATMKEAQASSPESVLSDTLKRSKEEQQIRQLNFDKNAATMPLNLSYDENSSAIKQMQDAMNSDFKTTGGSRKTDIKDFYSPYVTAEQSAVTQKAKDKEISAKQISTLDSVASTLDELDDLAKKYNIFDIGASKIGLSPAEQIFNQKKALVGQQIAKLAEYGKTTGGRGLSDKDREFYQNKVMGGVNAIGLQGNISEVIRNLKRDIASSSGYDPNIFDAEQEEKKQSKSSGGTLPQIGKTQKIGKYSVVIE